MTYLAGDQYPHLKLVSVGPGPLGSPHAIIILSPSLHVCHFQKYSVQDSDKITPSHVTQDQ